MILLDVNVLVYAHRAEVPQHRRALAFLNQVLDGEDPFAASTSILASFVRIVTHHKIFSPPTPVDVALKFVATIREQPHFVQLEPADRHWDCFANLCQEHNIKGGLIIDAWIAALAIEHRCDLATADGDFRRFTPRLRLHSYLR